MYLGLKVGKLYNSIKKPIKAIKMLKMAKLNSFVQFEF